jgi:DNA-binding transcriptional regulator YdaS (Cro superfamily)
MQKLLAFLEKQPAGYKTELAGAIGRHPSYFSRQLSGDRSFTAQDCIGIEKFTGGQVRCEDVLPDVDWAFLRNSTEATV